MKICSLHRMALVWASDGDASPPRWAARHLRACPECQHLHQAQVQLAASLIAAAPAQQRDCPPWLHAKIMARVETESREAQHPTTGVSWIRAMLIPALGVLLVAAYWTWDRQPQPSSHTVSLSPVQLQQILSKPDPAQVLAWTEKLDQPLQSEIHFVVSDAKLALRSLRANFLPEHEF